MSTSLVPQGRALTPRQSRREPSLDKLTDEIVLLQRLILYGQEEQDKTMLRELATRLHPDITVLTTRHDASRVLQLCLGETILRAAIVRTHLLEDVTEGESWKLALAELQIALGVLRSAIARERLN